MLGGHAIPHGASEAPCSPAVRAVHTFSDNRGSPRGRVRVSLNGVPFHACGRASVVNIGGTRLHLEWIQDGKLFVPAVNNIGVDV